MKIEKPEFLTRTEVARLFGVTNNTIANWEKHNKFPKGLKPLNSSKGHVRYRYTDVESYYERSIGNA